MHQQFSMVITNLLLRPITALVLLRFYNERSGQYSSFLPTGLGTGFASPFGPVARGSYEDIDAPTDARNTRQAIPRMPPAAQLSNDLESPRHHSPTTATGSASGPSKSPPTTNFPNLIDAKWFCCLLRRKSIYYSNTLNRRPYEEETNILRRFAF